MGTPAIGGTCGTAPCEGICGPAGICLPDMEKQGQPCTDVFGECTTNDVCTGTFCFGTLKLCEDADGNACTPDFCNPENGECVVLPISPCDDCETCNSESGECEPANQGGSCDDFNECTNDGTCQDGICQGGAPLPTDGTPTATPTEDLSTPTETPTTDASTPTDTPEPTLSATPTDTGTPLGTPTDTPTPDSTPTDTATIEFATPTDTPVVLPSDTPTEAPTDTPTEVSTETPTGIPTGTATATATFTPTGIPTGTATATATATGVPTGTATATVTVTPTGVPTGTATATATITPTRTNTATVVIPATSTATATNTALPVVASIIVGSATGEPGSTVTFDTSLETEAADVAGVQVDIGFDADAPIAATENDRPDCTVNPAIDKGATSFAFQPSECTPGEDCTGIRAIVLSLDNVDPIPDGSVLFTCAVAIADDASGSYALPCSNPGAGDEEGNRLGAECEDGAITVAVETDATIVIGSIVGAAGDTRSLEVTLDTEVEVAGTQNDITFPAGVGVIANNNGRPTCAVNPDIEKGGTSFAFQPSGCTPGTDCTGIRSLVLALDNVDPIPDGSLLYACQVSIGTGVANGTYDLTCTNAGASDPDGGAVPTDCIDGELFVGVDPTATVTPTATPTITTEPTPTDTPTATTPSPTNTPSPLPTRTRKPGGNDDDGCQVVAPAESSTGAWLLLLPAALLFRRRRRR
jgi:MYXO-CTERM domain-containing protein